MWAAATLSETNSLPEVFHVLNHFSKFNILNFWTKFKKLGHNLRTHEKNT